MYSLRSNVTPRSPAVPPSASTPPLLPPPPLLPTSSTFQSQVSATSVLLIPSSKSKAIAASKGIRLLLPDLGPHDSEKSTKSPTPSSPDSEACQSEPESVRDDEDLSRAGLGQDPARYEFFPIKRRCRTSPTQLKTLEQYFAFQSTRPSLTARTLLSLEVTMTPRQIQVWVCSFPIHYYTFRSVDSRNSTLSQFQNRRAKTKKVLVKDGLLPSSPRPRSSFSRNTDARPAGRKLHSPRSQPSSAVLDRNGNVVGHDLRYLDQDTEGSHPSSSDSSHTPSQYLPSPALSPVFGYENHPALSEVGYFDQRFRLPPPPTFYGGIHSDQGHSPLVAGGYLYPPALSPTSSMELSSTHVAYSQFAIEQTPAPRHEGSYYHPATLLQQLQLSSPGLHSPYSTSDEYLIASGHQDVQGYDACAAQYDPNLRQYFPSPSEHETQSGFFAPESNPYTLENYRMPPYPTPTSSRTNSFEGLPAGSNDTPYNLSPYVEHATGLLPHTTLERPVTGGSSLQAINQRVAHLANSEPGVGSILSTRANSMSLPADVRSHPAIREAYVGQGGDAGAESFERRASAPVFH